MNLLPAYSPLHHAALAALREALDNLPTAYLSLATMLREVYAHPELHWPHPLFLLDQDELLDGGGLNQARLVGWQFLARVNGMGNYAIEVQGSLDGTDCQFAKMVRSPFIDGLCQALENPDLQELLKTSETYLAVLILSELDTQVVWLRGPDAGREFLFALPQAADFLKPWPAIYKVLQFEAAVRKEAQLGG